MMEKGGYWEMETLVSDIVQRGNVDADLAGFVFGNGGFALADHLAKLGDGIVPFSAEIPDLCADLPG